MSKFIQQHPLILASSSQIRFKLLHSLGLAFSVIPSTCDEEQVKQLCAAKNPIELAHTLAACKALEVSERHPEHFVIAADQICLLGERILDKPLNHRTAIEHLSVLSGKTHQQIACVCIAQNNELLWQHHESAQLTLYPLKQSTIEAYLLCEKPYQSCGAYHYESQGKWLFQEVQGNEDTILGLPLLPLAQALMTLGVVNFLPQGSSII